MAKLQNRFVMFGAIAAAALAVPGLLAPLGFQEAHAQRGVNQAIEQVEQTASGVIAANVNVGANVGVNVEDNEVAACVIVQDCDVTQ